MDDGGGSLASDGGGLSARLDEQEEFTRASDSPPSVRRRRNSVTMPDGQQLANRFARQARAVIKRVRLRAQHGAAVVERIVDLEMGQEQTAEQIHDMQVSVDDAMTIARALTSKSVQVEGLAKETHRQLEKYMADKEGDQQLKGHVRELEARVKAMEGQISGAGDWREHSEAMRKSLEEERARADKLEQLLLRTMARVDVMWSRSNGHGGADARVFSLLGEHDGNAEAVALLFHDGGSLGSSKALPDVQLVLEDALPAERSVLPIDSSQELTTIGHLTEAITARETTIADQLSARLDQNESLDGMRSVAQAWERELSSTLHDVALAIASVHAFPQPPEEQASKEEEEEDHLEAKSRSSSRGRPRSSPPPVEEGGMEQQVDEEATRVFGFLRKAASKLRANSLPGRQLAWRWMRRCEGVLREVLSLWPGDDRPLPPVDKVKHMFGEASTGMGADLFDLWVAEEARQGRVRDQLRFVLETLSATLSPGVLVWGRAPEGHDGKLARFESSGLWWEVAHDWTTQHANDSVLGEEAIAAMTSFELVLPSEDVVAETRGDPLTAREVAVREDLLDQGALCATLSRFAEVLVSALQGDWPAAVLTRNQRKHRIALAAISRAQLSPSGSNKVLSSLGDSGAAVQRVQLGPLRRLLRTTLHAVQAALCGMQALQKGVSTLTLVSRQASQRSMIRVAAALDSSASLLFQATRAAQDAGDEREQRLDALETFLQAMRAELSSDDRMEGIEERLGSLSRAMGETQEGLSTLQAEILERASRKEMEDALRAVTEALEAGESAEELRKKLGRLAQLVDAKADESELKSLQSSLRAALDKLNSMSTKPNDPMDAILSTRKCMSCGRPLAPDALDLGYVDPSTLRPTSPFGNSSKKRVNYVPAGGSALPGGRSLGGGSAANMSSQLRFLYTAGSTGWRRKRQPLMVQTTHQHRAKGRNPVALTGSSLHPHEEDTGSRPVRSQRARRGSGGGWLWPHAEEGHMEQAPGAPSDVMEGGGGEVVVLRERIPHAPPGSVPEATLEGWFTQSMPDLPTTNESSGPMSRIPGGSWHGNGLPGTADPSAAAGPLDNAFYTVAQRSSGEYYAQFTVAGTKRAGGSGTSLAPASRRKKEDPGSDWLKLSPVKRAGQQSAAGNRGPGTLAKGVGHLRSTEAGGQAIGTLSGSRLGGGDSAVRSSHASRRRPSLTHRMQEAAANAASEAVAEDASGRNSPAEVRVVVPTALVGKLSPDLARGGRTTPAMLRRQAGEELDAAALDA
jgi:hypothetical protein